MSINNLTIVKKVLLLLLIPLLGLLAAGQWLLSDSQKTVYAEREAQLKHNVSIALTVLSHFQQQEAVLGREAAQKAASEAVKSLRYDGKNYFWIMTPQSEIVMHPFRPDMDGTDQSLYQDKKGNYLFQEMSAVVRRQGSGYVDYYWTRPDGDVPVAKRSYVEQLPAWGWIVGTGVYIDDVEAIFYSQLMRGGVALLAIILVSLVGFAWLARISTPRIAAILDSLQQIEQGDLSHPVEDNGKDEFGIIARAIEQMRLSQRELLTRLEHNADTLQQTATNLASMTEQARSGSQQQLEELEQVATAMTESSSANQEVMHNAHQLSEVGHNTDNEAKHGADALSNAIGSVERAANQVADASGAVVELKQDVEGIGAIVNVINDISEQTNLLALNAAIEAARAGEQGRGFSVVADEVRNLAQRTQDSTGEIQAMIQQLQSKAEQVANVMAKSQQDSVSSVDTAQSAGERLGQITTLMGQLNDMSTQIASSTEEQSAVAEDLNRNLLRIRDGSESAYQAAQSIGQDANNLAGLSQQLSGEIRRYRL